MSKDQHLQHILFRERVLQNSTLHCKSTKTNIFSDWILEFFWRWYSLFIYSFIHLLLFLIGVCSIHCVNYHDYSESLGHISIAQICEIDCMMFNANYRNISGWWSATTKHSPQSSCVANNQCDCGLVVINNVKEKG